MEQEVFIGKIISFGRITIPENIRNDHDIQDGDFVELSIVRVIKPQIYVAKAEEENIERGGDRTDKKI